jgi:hypothetical protein
MQSPMIRVLDRVHLNAPLARMEIEADARITRDVAAQLAEREGYAAVITGEVARAGSGYVLTASIRAGDGFAAVAGFRETARNDDELIGAIDRLSRNIRDKAGEPLRTVQGGRSLEQVTTSSLAALRDGLQQGCGPVTRRPRSARARRESVQRAGFVRDHVRAALYWSIAQVMSLGQSAREARIAVNYSLHGEPSTGPCPCCKREMPAPPSAHRLPRSAACRRPA